MSEDQQDKSTKSTNAEVNQRVETVQELILEGRTRSYIVRYCSTHYNVGSRQVDDYISKATQILKEVNAATLQENMSVITNSLWQLFREAREAKNIQEQHKILMSLSKLKGLDQTTVNHVIEDKRELSGMSNEELDQILEQNPVDNH